MSIAVVGLGSMGKRRTRHLVGLGRTDVVAVDPREDRRKEAEERFGVRTSPDLESVSDDIKALFVCVPGYLHMRYCLEAARKGRHWFCEVPLSIDLEGVRELRKLTTEAGLIGAPGCQLLFHPLAQALLAWRSNSQSRLLHASYSSGSYLPDWHRYEDYRAFYASDRTKGGGNLDVIAQEMTWLRWVAGSGICEVTARTGRIGDLELAEGTPDHHELIVELADGAVMNMHFDLNDRTHERILRLVGTEGSAKWSTLNSYLETYDPGSAAWTRHAEPEGFEYERCYRDEVARFLECIEGRGTWPVSIDSAVEVVRLLLAIERSSREGRTVALAEI